MSDQVHAAPTLSWRENLQYLLDIVVLKKIPASAGNRAEVMCPFSTHFVFWLTQDLEHHVQVQLYFALTLMISVGKIIHY